jgi:hypothetical protein
VTLRLLPRLDASSYRDYRRRAIFACHKWDPQVEDVPTIAPYALAISSIDWAWLAAAAQRLAAEVVACETELWQRPDLDRALAIPWPLRAALRSGRRHGAPISAARVMRFDFHPTGGGWRISEVNSDVPGGFNEAGGLTGLMAEHHPSLRSAGDPADLLARRVAAVAGSARVALVHCSAYSDDRQVMEFLGDRLRAYGAHCLACAPDAVRWRDRRAFAGDGKELGALVRFFPAEWMPQLPLRSRWWSFFAGGGTPAANPGMAVLSQSKRLPLVWRHLATRCPTWETLLPETRDVRDVSAWNDGWLLKPAWGRVGEGVVGPGYGATKDWDAALRSSRLAASQWIAQRRFLSHALDGPDGPLHACLGVYTVDGCAAGIYGRVVPAPPVDHRAREVAVLVDPACDQEGHAA